ncbi:MAG TPA: alpha/beta hydrolase [Roseiarcus sp.]|nr:alpha/beta hydrolase [Roseiarcus sp.]
MQTFRSDDVTIAFRDIPAEGIDLGEPILLIHGFASSHRINWIDPRWATTLAKAGRRVVLFDNRGHGMSEKLYDAEGYATPRMAGDAANLLAHLSLRRADVMGYSMGARIGAFLALERPALVRSLTLGGLGIHLVDGVGLPLGVADAMEAPSLDALRDPMQRMFRAFADQNHSDLKALAACIRGSRQTLTREEVAEIKTPALVAVGTADTVAGDAHALAALLPNGAALDIPGRDHNRAVGDRVYKEGVLAFLAQRP